MNIYFDILYLVRDYFWIGERSIILFALLFAPLAWLAAKRKWRCWSAVSISLITALSAFLLKAFAINESTHATAGDLMGLIGLLFAISPVVILAIILSLPLLMFNVWRHRSAAGALT